MAIMDIHIARLYAEAPRFDEGELYQSEKYDKMMRERMRIREVLEHNLNPILHHLLDDYAETYFDEMGMEAMHFFQEGYRAAKKEE